MLLYQVHQVSVAVFAYEAEDPESAQEASIFVKFSSKKLLDGGG
jgi:hypothetical protein